MRLNTTNSFRCLKTKEIYAILDGDVKFEEYTFSDNGDTVEVSMPYLSGSALCSISTNFGLPVTYHWKNGTNLSRWQYLENLFEYCIKEDKCDKLLAYLFNKSQFSSILSGHTPKATIDAYEYFVKLIVDKIHGLLSLSSNELIINNSRFVIRKIGDNVAISAPTVKKIDRRYIQELSDRALNDIRQSNYDSAITKSRTLLEEVFHYAIEKKSENSSTSGEIRNLYNQVKDLYSMHGNGNIDRRINTLLSGLEKIVTAITEMRNMNSDAHGVGAARIRICEHHARLFVNSAVAMAEFILSVVDRSQS